MNHEGFGSRKRLKTLYSTLQASKSKLVAFATITTNILFANTQHCTETKNSVQFSQNGIGISSLGKGAWMKICGGYYGGGCLRHEK
jgi:hypothetical protein